MQDTGGSYILNIKYKIQCKYKKKKKNHPTTLPIEIRKDN